MEDIFFNGIWRMDWGLGNPNKTATLIAELMVAVWILAYVRKWGFWAVIGLFTVLGGCLIHTFSRGGLIAAFAGLIALIAFIPRPWPVTKSIAISVSMLMMIAFSLYLNACQRYGQGVIEKDRSITNRAELWKAAPAMMVDAPKGWGWGNSGNAYMQWYQPLDHSEVYRTLVNSHLTWLVEGSWLFRFLYILAWFAVLTLCWPSKEHHRLAIPFGVWAAFAVAACFSSVAESVWLWIVPGVSLAATLAWRIRRNEWPRPKIGLVLMGTAGVMTLVLFVLGQGGTVIQGSRDRVVVGSGKPQVWMVVDTKTLGNRYGKTLRRFLQSAGNRKATVALVNSVALVSDVSGQIVILSGPLPSGDKAKVKTVFATAERVVLINPSFFPQDVNFSPENATKTEIVYGEFCRSPAISSWTKVAPARSIDGAGDFLPHWPEAVLAHL